MKRIAIIGGGISGLSAAFTLEKQRIAGASLEYSLFESGTRLGGVVRTERVDEYVIEAGRIHFSQKSHGPAICAARSGSAINSLALMTPIVKLTFCSKENWCRFPMG